MFTIAVVTLLNVLCFALSRAVGLDRLPEKRPTNPTPQMAGLFLTFLF